MSYNKYLKYKNKYLNLKNNILQGGVVKTYPIKSKNQLPYIPFNTEISIQNLLKYLYFFIINITSYSYSELNKYIINMYSDLEIDTTIFTGNDYKLLLSSGDYVKIMDDSTTEYSNIEYYENYNIHTCLPEFINNQHSFYTYKDNIITEYPYSELSTIRQKEYIFDFYDIIQNIIYLLEYNSKPHNINKKYIFFMDIMKKNQLEKFINLFINKCSLISSLEYRIFYNQDIIIKNILQLLNVNGIIIGKGYFKDFFDSHTDIKNKSIIIKINMLTYIFEILPNFQFKLINVNN